MKLQEKGAELKRDTRYIVRGLMGLETEPDTTSVIIYQSR